MSKTRAKTEFESKYSEETIATFYQQNKIAKCDIDNPTAPNWFTMPLSILTFSNSFMKECERNASSDYYSGRYKIDADFKKFTDDMSIYLESLMDAAINTSDYYQATINKLRECEAENERLKQELAAIKQKMGSDLYLKLTSDDKRRIAAAYTKGKSVQELSKKYGLSQSYIYKIINESKSKKKK